MDLCEFEAYLVYRVNFRLAGAVTQRDPVSKTKQTNKTGRLVWLGTDPFIIAEKM